MVFDPRAAKRVNLLYSLLSVEAFCQTMKTKTQVVQIKQRKWELRTERVETEGEDS